MPYDYIGEPEATYRIVGYRIDCPDPAEADLENPRIINIMKEISITTKNGKKDIICSWRLRGFWKHNETTVAEPEVKNIITLHQSDLYRTLNDGTEFGEVREKIEKEIKELFEKSEELKKRNAVIIPPSTGMTSALKQR
jgi:hypothetical protein